jgi:hypothetical protein
MQNMLEIASRSANSHKSRVDPSLMKSWGKARGVISIVLRKNSVIKVTPEALHNM